jgi:hypothetical protein
VVLRGPPCDPGQRIHDGDFVLTPSGVQDRPAITGYVAAGSLTAHFDKAPDLIKPALQAVGAHPTSAG